MIADTNGLSSAAGEPNIWKERKIPRARDMVSTVTFAVCRMPFISLPHSRFRMALTSGIPGSTSITSVWIMVGSLSEIPSRARKNTAVVENHMTKALVSILSMPGMASRMSR